MSQTQLYPSIPIINKRNQVIRDLNPILLLDQHTFNPVNRKMYLTSALATAVTSTGQKTGGI